VYITKDLRKKQTTELKKMELNIFEPIHQKEFTKSILYLKVTEVGHHLASEGWEVGVPDAKVADIWRQLRQVMLCSVVSPMAQRFIAVAVA
jgi:hypothetical protein